MINPVGYLEMIWLIQNCSLVITDSGGLQKEAYFFEKCCLTTRAETEWVELVESGNNILVGYEVNKILSAFNTQRKFKSFGPKDIAFLDSLSYQFSFSNLNDSIWVSKREFLKSVNFTKDIDEFNFVKKSNFFQIEDSLELYLFYIKNILLRKDIPPLGYIDNTIKKIIFNKRKLKFIKKFEKDIIQDAIKTNRFEIY